MTNAMNLLLKMNPGCSSGYPTGGALGVLPRQCFVMLGNGDCVWIFTAAVRLAVKLRAPSQPAVTGVNRLTDS
jgi:hypothetical protein